MKKIYLISIMVLLFVGCTVEQKEKFVEPEVQAKIVETLDTTEDVGGVLVALGALWPALIPIGTLVIGAAGMAKKVRPRLVEAESNTEALQTIVSSIDEFKESNPIDWASLKKVFHNRFSPHTSEIVEKFQ
jgi:hypothetical protein